MSNVIALPVITRLNLDPDRVLQSAVGELEDVVVIGFDKDGGEYFASSVAAGPEVLWLIERMKKALLEVGDDD